MAMESDGLHMPQVSASDDIRGQDSADLHEGKRMVPSRARQFRGAEHGSAGSGRVSKSGGTVAPTVAFIRIRTRGVANNPMTDALPDKTSHFGTRPVKECGLSQGGRVVSNTTGSNATKPRARGGRSQGPRVKRPGRTADRRGGLAKRSAARRPRPLSTSGYPYPENWGLGLLDRARASLTTESLPMHGGTEGHQRHRNGVSSHVGARHGIGPTALRTGLECPSVAGAGLATESHLAPGEALSLGLLGALSHRQGRC